MIKLFRRDILDRPGYNAIVVLCVIFAVVIMFCVSSYSTIIADLEIGYSLANGGENELTISANSLTGGSLVPTAPLKTADGVESYVGVFESYVSYKVKDGDYNTAFVRGFEKSDFEKIHAIEYFGKLFDSTEEIREDQVVVSRKFAESNGLMLNSAITLVTGVNRKLVFVGGIAENEGYFYGNSEIILATNACVSKLYGLNIGHIYNKVYVNVQNDKADEVLQVLSTSDAYKSFNVEYSSNTTSTDEITKAFTIGFLLCAIALVIASMLIVYKVFDAQYKAKSTIISRLKILGARNGKIAALFLSETTVICAIGIVLGSIIATFSYRLLVQKTTGLTPVLSWNNLLISAGTVFFVSLLTATRPIITAAKQSIKECMTEAKSTDYKPNLILLSVMLGCLTVCLILEFTLPFATQRAIAAVGSLAFSIGLIVTTLPFAFKGVGYLLSKCKAPIPTLAAIELKHNKKSLSTMQIASSGTIFCVLVFIMLNAFNVYLTNLLVYSEDVLLVANVSGMEDDRLRDFAETEGVNYATGAYRAASGSIVVNGYRNMEVVGIDEASRLIDMIPYDKGTIDTEEFTRLLQDTSKDYIIINRGYCRIHDVEIGDEILIEYKGISHTYVVGEMIDVSGSITHSIVNRKNFVEYFGTEPYNVVFVNADNPSDTADALRSEFKDDKIEVIPMQSLISLKVARNVTTINFISVMSIFITAILVAAMLCNILLGELSGERENSQLIMLGVSRGYLLLRTLLFNFIAGLIYVVSILSLGALVSYTFCDAAILTDAYVAFEYFPGDSLLMLGVFFAINLIVAPVFRLLKPNKISAKQLRTL